MESWSREEISTCGCSERTYRHVHCPCLQCRGSATDRNTELRQGEGPSDVWYGHVQDIDFRNKSVDVYFFIESRRCPNVFVRESRSRGARNTVSWRSVIGVADGHWSGPGMWTKDL